MKILVVEDDKVIGRQVCEALEREGHRIAWTRDGERGLQEGATGAYDLLILDVMLPNRDGISICKELRSRRMMMPILIMTAKDAVEDRVSGLEHGADDYLPKPFDLRELLARVQVLFRRTGVQRSGVMTVRDLEIDTGSRQVRRGSSVIELTPREFTLLEALARNEGRTLTRQVILESIWGNEDCTDNAVSFHVASLRRKLESIGHGDLIRTVHGIGYMLNVGEGVSSPR